MRLAKRIGIGIFVSLVIAMPVQAEDRPTFTPEDVRRILAHGPWPMPWTPDPSNRVSGQPAAAAFGRQLFFDKRLSRFGALSCAFCHKPEMAWGDGRAQASSAARLDRNTTSLTNARYFKWFGWDGASDSLWMHSLRPLLEPREMAASPEHVRGVIVGDSRLAAAYRKVFGKRAAAEKPETALVNAAKALAAFQETIVTSRTAFDLYRDALAKWDQVAMARYSAAAERGLKIFVGKGQCSGCHAGPRFSNDEFYNNGLSRSDASDPGRRGGLLKLKESLYNRLGNFSDETLGEAAELSRDAVANDQSAGAFKVPSLRNAALTGPYMHNGAKATLGDVVRHYSELEGDQNLFHDPKLAKRLNLSELEIGDLVAFLESLTDGPSANKGASGSRRSE